MVQLKTVTNVYKTKHSGSNTTISNKEIILQQTQTAAMLNAPKLRNQQSIANVKRNVISVKLPTITRKTVPTTVKPVQSAHTQNSSKQELQVSSAAVINECQPLRPLNPMIIQRHLPSIKDHTIKDNLIQKPTLKSKSPRPGSLSSQSNATIIHESEQQIKTHHPLQYMDVGCLLSESARHRLKHLFNRLDTDRDGHLLYSQFERCLPSNLPRAQVTFFRVLYDIIIDATFFGLQEFYATAIVVDMIAKQNSRLWNTYLDDVDFNYYHDNIIELLDRFNHQCSITNETINYEDLVELIMKQRRNIEMEHIRNELEYVMPKIKVMELNRLDFIGLLPVIIYIQSRFVDGRKLFHFGENSILDVHMQQALLA